MNRCILALFLLLSLPSISLAQPINMRFLAADQLFLYGQAIYDRKDYQEAANVFTRLLWLNPNHTGGLYYAYELIKKGYHVIIPDPTVVIKIPAGKVVPIVGPNEDLKQAIFKADQSIAQLKTDIGEINSQITQGQTQFQNDKILLKLK